MATLIWASIPTVAAGAVSVLTYHNDNARTGQNTNEVILTPANVKTNTFGLLFSQPVDGYVYAQPLVLAGVPVPGGGTRNVLFIATENDSVYAFDADDNSGTNAAPLWKVSFINPALGVTTVPVSDTGTGAITPDVGITATPVIDAAAGTIYVAAYTKEVTATATNYIHRLHALDVATGGERAHSPVVIACTNYPGSGMPGYTDNDGAGHVLWNGKHVNVRSALLLDHGVVYVSLGSHGDVPPYHGWVFAYDPRSLQQTGVYNTSPNGGRNALWMSGGGPATDSAGNLYFLTGNGDFSTNYPAASSYSVGDSFVKLTTTNGLALADYFAPYNQASLSSADSDLGAGGVIMLPDSWGSAAHPHLMVGAGKEGSIYLVDRDNLGHFNSAGDSQIVQKLPAVVGLVHSTPALFNNQIFYQSSSYPLTVFSVSNGLLSTSAVARTTGTLISTTPAISANGTNNAIVWLLDNAAANNLGQAVLHAYSVTNLAHELYNSGQAGIRDRPGAAVKFTSPIVANGKVYVGAEDRVSVYGSGTFLAPPIISPSGGSLTNSVTVTLSDSSPGVTIYYTLDQSPPTTNSTPYTGAFVLTDSAVVSAIAAAPGAVNSGVTTAVFVNSSAVGNGTGLAGAYYTNVPTSSAFKFSGVPALTRVDPVINFQWGTGSFASGYPATNYSVRWTGMVQPQYTETYTFQCLMDDGVRLWINGQLLIDKEYFVIGPSPWTVSLPLVAQQKYNIEVDYYQRVESSEAVLSWSSPSTPQAVVPATQLYPMTNPPPGVVITSPSGGSAHTAAATVTLSADAADQYNAVAGVTFYTNNGILGTVTNAPYTITAPGLAAGNYVFKAVATDTTGLSATSAPVSIAVTNGSGLPYGLTTVGTAPPFLNMPATFDGILPTNLSLTGVFTNTPGMSPSASLIPYTPNTPLWSDGALKLRYFGLPNSGAPYTPDEQITFSPTGAWSFPAGTVFVKTFELLTNQSDPNSIRRLETRLLVRDANGAAYGVTYKWRPDNSDADLLAGSLSEDIAITSPSGVITQTWYYPSPADCLQCHTPVANYVLGLNTRQFNTTMTYPSSGVVDNQLRTLNRLGLLYPAIDERAIAGYEKLSALTNTAVSLEERVKSYLDANCAQCHQPGGTGPTFDARYETALTNQNLINGVLSKGDLGYDNAFVIMPEDTLRSVLYDRMNTTNDSIKMPSLARALIDTNAVTVFAAWINSLPGTPALTPPVISPGGGTFVDSVSVSIQSPDPDGVVYYTLDGTLPTTNSLLYNGPFTVANNQTVNATACGSDYRNSVAAKAQFIIQPGLTWTSPDSIVYGTPLDGSQLNASATVAGSFAYNPAAGAVLNSGTNPLSAIFTPADTVNYSSATTSVSLVVLPAPLTVTAANAARAYGQPNPAFTGTLTGLKNGDVITALYNTTAGAGSPVGSYPIIPSLVDSSNRLANYSVTINNGTLTVALPPTVTTHSATAPASTSAMLNGTVNPNGYATAVYFIWGAGTAGGHTNLAANLPAGIGAVNVSNTLTGLIPATAYGFQVRAVNALGTSTGSQLMFNTTGIPGVTGVSASAITANSAVLNGSALPKGASSGAWFGWGVTTNYGQTTAVTNIGNGWAYLPVNGQLSGLTPGTTYHFRLFVTNNVGLTNSADFNFSTVAPPTAITHSATGLAPTSAIFNGTVNPNGAATAVYFTWGPGTASGNTNLAINLPAGFGAVNVSNTITGLAPHTAYSFQVMAVNAQGTNLGSQLMFNTTGTPETKSVAVGGVAATSAVLTGSVLPRGASCGVWFVWGPTTNYGHATVMTNIGNGWVYLPITNQLTGLNPGTTYHFQLLATNNVGVTNSGDFSFTTLALPPVATTHSVTDLTPGSATFNSTVNPNGAATAVYFIWGPGTNAGRTNLAVNLPAGAVAINVSNSITGLAPATAYGFQVMAVNALGANVGSQLMFNTLGTPETKSVSVSGVSSTSAVLTGLALPRGASCGAWFAWGITTNYGQITTVTNLGNGWVYLAVSNQLTGLNPGTTYHCALFATNSVGATNSTDVSFTTAAAGRGGRDVNGKPPAFTGNAVFTGEGLQLELTGLTGRNYVLQATTNFSSWISVSTNTPLFSPFYLKDPNATNFGFRFYRAVQQP